MKSEKVVLGGGCFWCTEAVFKQLSGVSKVTPGYAGGNVDNPSYLQVSSGETGHAEVVDVEYDREVIGLKDLLKVFFSTHNPTTANQQGADFGSQYRSIILYTIEDQKYEAEKYIIELEERKIFDSPIVTEIRPLENFYPAEISHHDYYELHQGSPYCQIVINPKIEKLRKEYLELIK